MKINIFDTFLEAKEAQEYDYNYQKIIGLSLASGIVAQVIRDNNLHILQDGRFPLEDYIAENSIKIPDLEIFIKAIAYWKLTTSMGYRWGVMRLNS